MTEPVRVIEAHDGWATGVAYLPDGTLLSTGVDPFIKHWDPKSGVLLSTLVGHEKSVDALAVSRDGLTLVSGSVDATVRIWELATGQARLVLAGHKKTVTSVAISPDSAVVASASYDRTVRLWDLATGEARAVLKGHTGNVVTCAFSPDGRLLATGGMGGEVRFWSMPDGKPAGVMVAHEVVVGALKYTADGSRLLTTGLTDLRIWRASDQHLEREVDLAAGGLHTIALDPEDRIAAVSGEQGVRVVALATGAVTATLTIPVKGVYGVAYSPDGRTVATASSDRMVRVWRAEEAWAGAAR